MQFGPKSGGVSQTSNDSGSSDNSSAKNAPEELDTIDYGDGSDVNPDDIPF
jgi:hypothetical protein